MYFKLNFCLKSRYLGPEQCEPASAECRLTGRAGLGTPRCSYVPGDWRTEPSGLIYTSQPVPSGETSPEPQLQPSLTATDLVQINNILLYIIVLQISCNSISVNFKLVQFVRSLQKQGKTRLIFSTFKK